MFKVFVEYAIKPAFRDSFIIYMQEWQRREGRFELLEGTDALKKGIQEHLRVAELLAIALEDGMRTLKQDGIEKVLKGITDMKQVRSVCIK